MMMSILHACLERAGALRRAGGGSVAIEFGLAAPLMIVALVPMVDLGMGIYQRMQVQDAVQAGAQYAMRHSPFDPTAVVAAVNRATAIPSLAVDTPAQSCGCADSGTVAAATCGSICADGQTAGSYVTVSAQAPYTPLMPYPGLGSVVTLSAQATARIR